MPDVVTTATGASSAFARPSAKNAAERSSTNEKSRTSGTAAAELLPAAIEAHYSGIPLILITADRPARFRGTGAPQSIEQEGLFGVYAETSMETWTRKRPLHINIAFDEPLL